VTTRVNPHEPMSRRNAVVGLTWTIPEVRHFAALRVDGTVQVWEGSGNNDEPISGSSSSREPGRYRLSVEIPRVFSTTEAAGGNNEEGPTGARGSSSTSKAIGIHSLEASSHSRLVACNAAGTIAVINPFAEDDSNHVVSKFDTLASSGAKQQQQSSQAQGENAHTTAFTVQPTTGVAAVGAKDREIVLWDLETGQRQWKAKNLPPDPQTLLQPRVWPTAACFLSTCNAILFAVGSAYHQVRIYDVRAPQRRPVRYTLEDNDYLSHRVTALCSLNDHEVVVGDAGGYIQSLDLRLLSTGANVKRHTASPVVGRFVGPAGSVRQLVAFSSSNNNTSNRLACVGLDRTLRVYDTTTRRSLQTVYLKQRLNCLLVSEEEEDDDDEDDNDEDAAVLEDDEMMEQQDKVHDYVDTSDDDEDDEDGDDESSVVDVVETIDEVPDDDDDDESSEEGKEKEVTAPRRKQQRRR